MVSIDVDKETLLPLQFMGVSGLRQLRLAESADAKTHPAFDLNISQSDLLHITAQAVVGRKDIVCVHVINRKLPVANVCACQAVWIVFVWTATQP